MQGLSQNQNADIIMVSKPYLPNINSKHSDSPLRTENTEKSQPRTRTQSGPEIVDI